MTAAVPKGSDCPEGPGREPGGSRLLFDGADWNFATMRRVYEAIEEIAVGDLGLNTFPNQIEVISAEQMLDCYCANGMPLMYSHWSYGKRFVREETLYRQGYQALAYEIVINSNPCISYYMEENTMPMQTLVLAHAAFGHNHFFKNNYLFQHWTDPNGILDYLEFAKHYVGECEERHGLAAVEWVLDAAHALMNQGVFRYRRASKLSASEYEARRRERLALEDKPIVIYGAPRLGPSRRAIRRRANRKRPNTNRVSACRKKICSISSRRTARCCVTGNASCFVLFVTSHNISIRNGRPR